MKRQLLHLVAFVALASLGLLVVACEDDKKPAPPSSSSASGTANATSPSATAGATAAASASASSESETDEPDDTTAEAATNDITADNFEKELDGLEKEVNAKY